MVRHVCLRCGLEDRCSYGSWPDRHPVMAVIAGLFTLVFGSMMITVYPGASAVIGALVLVAVVAYVVDRERRRRAALATRADWEHRQVVARAQAAPPRIVRTPLPEPRRPSGSMQALTDSLVAHQAQWRAAAPVRGPRIPAPFRRQP